MDVRSCSKGRSDMASGKLSGGTLQVRHRHGPRPSLRLVRCCAAAPLGPDQRRVGHVPDQARRAGRHRVAQAVHRLQDRRPRGRHLPGRR